MRTLRTSDITLPVGVESWDDLVTLAGKLPGWVFRGHRDIGWRLQPTLERWATQATSMTCIEFERRLLLELPSRIAHLISDAPSQEDAMGWFGVTQHYGGPSRLLDLTSSLPVAVFFALEKASDSGCSVVWAINDIVVRSRLEQILCDANGDRIPCRNGFAAGDLLNLTLHAECHGPAAAAGFPRRQSPRQQAQEGLFLFGLNPDLTLEQSLYGMFGVEPEDVYPQNLVGWLLNALDERVVAKLRRRPVVKIFINNRVRQGVLQELAATGVSRASLFPEAEPDAALIEEELSHLVKEISSGHST
jgi:hypothetical protein